MIDHIKNYIIILLIAGGAFCCCDFLPKKAAVHPNGTIRNEEQKIDVLTGQNPFYSDSLSKDSIRGKWIQDTLGCKHMRTLGMAVSLIKKYDLLHKSKENFLLVFGYPNEIQNTQSSLYLIYYLESVCENDTLIVDSDKSWVEFVFINDTLTAIPTDINEE